MNRPYRTFQAVLVITAASRVTICAVYKTQPYTSGSYAFAIMLMWLAVSLFADDAQILYIQSTDEGSASCANYPLFPLSKLPCSAPRWRWPHLAQGSAGGSIGNDDKEINRLARAQTRAAGKKATRRKAASRPPTGKKKAELARISTGAGHSSRPAVPVRARSGASIRGGRFTTRISHGTVSPEGAFHAVGGGSGLTFTAGGHMGSSSGSGTFWRSDGCSGSWHASRSPTRSGTK